MNTFIGKIYQTISNSNRIYLLIIIVLTIIVYTPIYQADFYVLDDLPAIVENPVIKDLNATIKTLNLQPILASVIYQIWGFNPHIYHIFSVLIHIINIVLSFILVSKLLGDKTAKLSILLFSIHPVNTEAVSWISGASHLYNTMFILLTILTYVNFRIFNNYRWLIISVLIYAISFIILKSPWLVILPPCLIIIDQLLLNKSYNRKTLKFTLIYFVALACFYLFYLNVHADNRLDQRSGNSSYVLLNQQLLTPFWESSAYTISKMFELYIFPINLSLYYDGTPVTNTYYLFMWLVFLVYISTLIYLYQKKQIRIFALLVILPILIWPTLSPVKITWFMAERYLYIGTIFYSCLMSLLVFLIYSKFKSRLFISLVLIILITLYSTKTFHRNIEWQDSVAFARATIISSPNSFRPYNDLAMAYILQNDYQQALNAYKKSLEIGPSDVAIKNTGYIYLQTTMPSIRDKAYLQHLDVPDAISDISYRQALSFTQTQQYQEAIYYFNLALEQGHENLENILLIASQIYIHYQKFDHAEKILESLLDLNPQSDSAYYWLGYISFVTKDYKQSKLYLDQSLFINPNNQEVINNLKLVEEQLQYEN